ncbi:HNH endonuclease signature motif containing protein [Corynebacterium mayonis]|uniref:HNH endonuclease signature motif containing protein n=1 Tax=Corynebacterium mayonis TaxID=3062461 RepID=UPI0031403042
MTTATIETNLSSATPSELISLIEKGFGSLTRQKATILHAIALFDALALAPQVGARTTASWLIRSLSVPSSSAHEYVHVARSLLAFSILGESFSAGRINYSKVRLLLSLLNSDNEEELVSLAEKMTYHELELALMKYRKKESAPARKSYIRMKTCDDGRIKLWGNFNASEGAKVMAAMKVGEVAWHDCDLNRLRAADGTIDEAALDGKLDGLEGASTSVSAFGLPLDEALLTSFMGLVNIALTKPKNPLRAPGAHVNVVMTTDGRAYLPHNPGAPSDAVKNLLSNAQFRINQVDDTGLVLNTGRKFRLATDAQINALMLMWRGKCAMPGCKHSRFMEMHHITDWADGGPTDLDNLLPLCSACHSLVSDRYIRILKDGGDVHFLFPDGSRYVSYAHGLAERNDAALTLQEFNEGTHRD